MAARKDKSRDNGGISEGDLAYVEQEKPPSKFNSIVDAVSEAATMGMTGRMKKNVDKKEREEFVKDYDETHGIESKNDRGYSGRG